MHVTEEIQAELLGHEADDQRLSNRALTTSGTGRPPGQPSPPGGARGGGPPPSRDHRA